MRQLVLATGNRHKVGELEALLTDLHLKLLTLEDFPGIPSVIEDRPTLEENALKKARATFNATKLPSLADDSGLEVHYLNGEPGVFSARYAGPRASYADNCKKLLKELRGVPPRRRAARFRCVLAFVTSGKQGVVEGVLPGSIIEEPRGALGFGYDPIFLPKGHSKTLAEMSPHLKNTLSHRAKAVESMRTVILEYFKNIG
ncbi:MAG: RdgB/HAM1 family non-canonical purine NTP pyrophosphatase [Bacteroidota bacterium]